MSNIGNKVSRLSAGTQARQGHRTEQPIAVSHSMQPVVDKNTVVKVSVKLKKTAKKRKKSK